MQTKITKPTKRPKIRPLKRRLLPVDHRTLRERGLTLNERAICLRLPDEDWSNLALLRSVFPYCGTDTDLIRKIFQRGLATELAFSPAAIKAGEATAPKKGGK